MTLTVGSLFAGIGGFDLAARNVGWSTAWYSEIDPYACRVMAKHFPDALNLGDITTIVHPPAVDVLCAGFPCQDISYAGQGAGLSGARSGLWSDVARITDEIRPRWVVAENVAALRTRGLGQVLSDLDALGYVGEWHVVPAAAVGADHLRERVWIIARRATHPLDCAVCECCDDRWCAVCEVHRFECECVHPDEYEATADAGSARSAARLSGSQHGQEGHTGVADHGGVLGNVRWQASEGFRTQPRVVAMAHGVSARLDRLRCLGNAIVPQVAEVIFRAIIAAEVAPEHTR